MKRNRCRGCGLVNFGDAAACRRCGLSLGAHSYSHRNGLRVGALGTSARLRGRLFVAAVAVSAVCGGTCVYRHPAATALRESITSKVAGGQPVPRADSAQPHLGDDAKKPARTLTVEEFERALDGGGEQAAGQPDELNRSEINRRYEEEHDRALRAGMQQERRADDQTRNDQAYQQRTPAGSSSRR